jgi:hypothetical protein
MKGIFVGAPNAKWLPFVALLIIVKQFIEVGERLIHASRLLCSIRCLPGIPVRIQVPRMRIVVTVDTQQLPVAPVGWVIIMVVVFVMDRELAKLLALKFTPAAGADSGKNLERLLTVSLQPFLTAAAGLGNQPVHPVTIQSFFL